MKLCFLYLALLCFLFNIELLPGLTITNIAIIILAVYLIVSLKEQRFVITRKEILEFLLPFFILGIIGSIGIINESADLTTKIKISFSWYLLCLSFTIGWLFHEYICAERFAYFAGITTIVVSLYAFIVSLLVGLGDPHYRFNVNSELAGGINGFMYGQFCLQIIFLSTIRLGKKLWDRCLWFLVATLPALVGLTLGSRQYIGSTVLLIVVIMVLNSRNLFKKVVRYKKHFVFIGIIPLLGLMITPVREKIFYRIAYTQKQLIHGSGRLEILQKNLADIDSNNFFGKGIGHSYGLVGYAPENFYIELLNDYGIFSFVILTFTVVFILVKQLQIIRKYHLFSINLGLWIFLFISFLWYAQFNEIIREYALWLIFGAMIANNYSVIKRKRYNFAKFKNTSKKTIVNFGRKL
jgi:hypothetical protein